MPRGIYARKKKGNPPEVRVPLDAVPDRAAKSPKREKSTKTGANMAVIAKLLVEVAKLI